jgi:hypothetical protein
MLGIAITTKNVKDSKISATVARNLNVRLAWWDVVNIMRIKLFRIMFPKVIDSIL